MTEANSENLLIGKKNTIDHHFKLQAEYEEGDNGEKFVLEAKEKAEDLKLFLELSEEKGLTSTETISQLKKMNSNSQFKDDKQIKDMVKRFKDLGWM